MSSGDARIFSGREVKVSFIQNTTIEALGDVRINREAINCIIRAGGNIEVLWNKGRIIGGDIIAGGWIAAPTLASATGNLLKLALEPRGWESKVNNIEKLDAKMEEVLNDESVSNQEQEENVQEHHVTKTNEIGELDKIFAKSFVTAKIISAPVEIRFGNTVEEVQTDIKSATFTLRKLKIHQERRVISVEERDKLRQTDQNNS